MNEFLEQFLIESRELVEQATGDLLALEESPQDHDRLDSAFRAFHTLKGAARIVEFDAMGRVLHAAEEMLVAVRAGEHPVTADLISDCLSSLDQVVQWLDAIETGGDLPTVAATTVDALLQRFEKADARLAPAPVATGWAEPLAALHPSARTAIRYAPDEGCFFRGEDPLSLLERVPGLLALDLQPTAPWPDLVAIDPFACKLVIVALSTAPPGEIASLLTTAAGQVQILALAADAFSSEAQALLQAQLLLVADREEENFTGRFAAAGNVVANVLRAQGRASHADALLRLVAAGDADGFAAALQNVLRGDDEEAGEIARAPQDVVARALRVEVERIDALVKLTGELTVVKNAVGHASRLAQGGADPTALAPLLKEQHALLDRLVSELQRSVLGIRVLPLRHVFQRFPKLVREMSASLGKPVRLLMEGEATEADKAIVEALFEPLLHVLRNALDHGIEPAESRAKAGKTAVATVLLQAVRDGEHVVVEVRDDGGGVDLDRVRRVAETRGIASADALQAMDEASLLELLFAPGFSTASQVTDISGRGVGMDAVRAAVARLGGHVSITSTAGHGTSVRFLLPFTLMMSRVMTVESGGQVFGIPFESILETVRIPRAQITQIGAAHAFVLRNQTVPLVDLAAALDLRGADEVRSDEANIVVTSFAGQLGAIEVDRFGERLDVMLKSMDGLLAGMGGVAGTTLLGDGRVLIVLDVQALLR
ncbi:chemotaxis protein CheA [Roseiterribacter gracilis]|uniref:Chemotaxis protein CheA n=1 Tax=Roseiterribacter gracilis TaxID=2812848 RepID=A0A8S8XJG5_9PROT|nr:hypothetical protein TMPK1_31070 [Rhodospirillales bacterium TMPK1]